MKKIFKMPKRIKITSRTSSITNAFVNGIIPCLPPSEAEVIEAIKILGMTENKVVCAYCGDAYNQWDHLEPIVENQRPTGYISEIYNLIPCCSICNSSKSGSNWLTWIRGNAEQNPKSRKIKNLENRITKILEYEKWCKLKRTKLKFDKIVGEKLWNEHWKNHDMIIQNMKEFQVHSNILKEKIGRAHV